MKLRMSIAKKRLSGLTMRGFRPKGMKMKTTMPKGMRLTTKRGRY